MIQNNTCVSVWLYHTVGSLSFARPTAVLVLLCFLIRNCVFTLNPSLQCVGFRLSIVKGLKNVTALVEIGEASTAAPAPADAVVHGEEPAQPAIARADPASAPSPTMVSADQSSEEAFREDGAGEVQTAELSKDESGSVQGEKESAATEERQQEATMGEPPRKVHTKPKARGELLLDLIRSFRGGMLRVDSNLRAAMFRSLRYLVRIVEPRSAYSPPSPQLASLVFGRLRILNLCTYIP